MNFQELQGQENIITIHCIQLHISEQDKGQKQSYYTVNRFLLVWFLPSWSYSVREVFQFTKPEWLLIIPISLFHSRVEKKY